MTTSVGGLSNTDGATGIGVLGTGFSGIGGTTGDSCPEAPLPLMSNTAMQKLHLVTIDFIG